MDLFQCQWWMNQVGEEKDVPFLFVEAWCKQFPNLYICTNIWLHIHLYLTKEAAFYMNMYEAFLVI